MAAETREQKVARLIEKHVRDRNMDPESIKTHYNVKHTGIELDPDFFDASLNVGWGFFTDKPRHLDHMTRNLLISVLLAWRSRPGCYHQGKKGVMLGATYEQMMEAYEAGSVPGGGPVLINGMTALKRMMDEGVVPGSQASPYANKWVQMGPKRPPAGKGVPAGPRGETRTEKLVRLIRHYNLPEAKELIKDLAYGAKLDPDFFEGYVRVTWTIFDEKQCHLDPIRREMAALYVLAAQGRSDEVYLSTKRCMELGATELQLLEGFEVCANGGGSEILHIGLRTLRRLKDEHSKAAKKKRKSR